jgi:hypothetical protein
MPNTVIVRAVLAPIGLLVAAALVFLAAGANGSLGPLGSAAVNWVFVALWAFAPVVGGRSRA